jgi:glyoxylase-like metal-dependent hydrolase (beta-lactamase superfamily II)
LWSAANAEQSNRLPSSRPAIGAKYGKWPWLIALALVPTMLVASALAEQAYPPLTRPLTVEQLPGQPIYYVVGQPGIPGKDNEGHTSNAGFVVTSQGVVVFDALGTPSLGWDLLQQIRKISDQPIRYIVVSHYHADHIYGLQAFKDHSLGVVIIAQERAGEYRENEQTTDERANQRLDQRREALFPWVNRNTRVVPPDITFRQRAVLTLGGKRFVLIYAGPGHSASDIMMMIEPDGVLFAGDIVQNSRIPFMNSDDVDTASWLRALADVETLNPKFIIPGHGKPSTAAKQAMAFTRDYIEYVRGAMSKAVENWIDFDAAYEQTDWSKYKSMPAFSTNNRGNAYRIFLELEQSQLKNEIPPK